MRALAPPIIAAGFAFAASAETGTLYARSTPPGAQVYLDGSRASSGTTPAVVGGLSPGEHKLRFVFPDGSELVRDARVKANELTSVSVGASDAKTAAPEKRVPPVLRIVVNVISDPPGAELSVDGKAVGRTPCAARGLSAGAHSFLLTKKGFAGHERSLSLKPGETRLLQAKLEPLSPPTRPARETSGVPKKTKKNCPLCQGTGHAEKMGCPTCRRVGCRSDGLTCTACGGRGTADAVCPGCRGTAAARGKACRFCDGTGKPKCLLCKGTGKIEVDNPDYYKDKYDIPTCPQCAGDGMNDRLRCTVCSGTGQRKFYRRSGRFTFISTRNCWFCAGRCESLPRCDACLGAGVLGGAGNAVSCLKCGGTGKLRAPCPACRGRGWIKKRKRR